MFLFNRDVIKEIDKDAHLQVMRGLLQQEWPREEAQMVFDMAVHVRDQVVDKIETIVGSIDKPLVAIQACSLSMQMLQILMEVYIDFMREKMGGTHSQADIIMPAKAVNQNLL